MPASSPDSHSFLPLHPLELRVLLVLAEGTAHGYSVVKEIEARERHLPRIYPANLYRRIRDLLRKGLLEDAEPPDRPDIDARRRYFRITELGQAVLRAEVARMKGLLSEANRATLFLERLRARP
ncbi:MAG: PadR family transcriptional regulator [Gemmatimonadales bacterium]|nr:PadR family transcriptional regulator [Gemmatimonadales bacterium]NIO31561.1 PadR family transcriptional regulator [Gemmatimonadota bacterium]